MKRISFLTLLGFISLIVFESHSVIQARQQTPEIFERLLSKQNVALPLSDVSHNRIQQLLSVEDPNYFQHSGFDFSTPGSGTTTITLAMVKYLYFNKYKPGFMKLEQTLIAWLAVTSRKPGSDPELSPQNSDQKQ